MSDKLNEKFEELVTEAGIIVESGDSMPTVTAAVIPGGQGSAPGQVSDAQTRGGAKDPQPTVTTKAVAPYHQTQGTDLGGPEPDGDDEGEENPGAKASAPVSAGISDQQTAHKNDAGEMGKTPSIGTQVAYGTSSGPSVTYPIKPSFEELDLSGDVAALTEGEDLSEEFRDKAKTIFEAAVRSKLVEEAEKLQEQFETRVAEQVESVKAELAEEVMGTINYAINQWLEENQVPIDRGVRNEITEDFIAGLKNLFQEHYINIPDDKIDVVEGMADELREMEQRLNEQVERNIELNNRLAESTRVVILNQLSEGLADTQKEKLASLSEGVNFESVDKFAEAVKTLRESYFPQSVSKTEVSDESPVESEAVTPAMAAYLNAISRWK
jgi:hypothetical protein